MGWDVHRLATGRPFVVGGVRIPHPRGPVGHSDGDALLHAVMDALLGAAGLGDIGEFFPDTSKAWRGVSSLLLLQKVMALVRRAGYRVVNLDTVVLLEEPKLGPHKARIRRALAAALDVSLGAVNVKAKTAEGLGAVGQKKAVSASCVVLLDSRRKK